MPLNVNIPALHHPFAERADGAAKRARAVALAKAILAGEGVARRATSEAGHARAPR